MVTVTSMRSNFIIMSFGLTGVIVNVETGGIKCAVTLPTL